MARTSVWSYVVIDLGRNDVAPSVSPISINNSSTVLLGTVQYPTLGGPYYMWTNGTLTPLPSSANFAYALNDNGDYVAGDTLVKNGNPTYLTNYALISGANSTNFISAGGDCLNNNDDVGGTAQYKFGSNPQITDNDGILFTYSSQSQSDVIPNTNSGPCAVWGINDSGVMIGNGNNPTSYTYYINSTPIQDNFVPAWINNTGQIVGNTTGNQVGYPGSHVKLRIGNYSPSNDIDLGSGQVPGFFGQLPWATCCTRDMSTPLGLDPFNVYVIGYAGNNSTTASIVPTLWWEATPSTNNGSGGFTPGNFASSSLTELIGPPTNSWLVTSVYAINDHGCATAVAMKVADGTSHAILLVPDLIQRDGVNVTANNNTVSVGQQVNLTNQLAYLPGNATVSYQWSIPGWNSSGSATNSTAFKDYEPTGNHSGFTALATSDLTNSFCNFYWSDAGTNRLVTCTTVVNGQTNTAMVYLTSLRPDGAIFGTMASSANIAADMNYNEYFNNTNYPFYPWLHYGTALTNAGATFNGAIVEPTKFSGGSSEWVQLINADTNIIVSSTLATNGGTVTVTGTTTQRTWSYGVDSALGFPYPSTATNTTEDSPGSVLTKTNISYYRSFDATMYLMWRPPTNAVGGDNTIWVPLSSFQWNWSATATNSSPTNNLSGWSVQNPMTPTNTVATTVTNEPSLSQSATNDISF